MDELHPPTSYADRLLELAGLPEPGGGRRRWLAGSTVVGLGALGAAAAAAWTGLAAAHPWLRAAACGYLAAEGLFFVFSKWR